MNESTLRAIELATRKTYPEEMCGFVLKDGSFVQVKNVSDNPTEHFEVDLISFHIYSEEIAYVVHSHTKTKYLHICTPSLLDIKSQRNCNIPYLIVGFDGSVFYPPVNLPTVRSKEYLNRPYIYGIQDCGTLMQDFYYYTFGISIYIDPADSIQPKKEWAKAVLNTLVSNCFLLQDMQLSSCKLGDMLITSIGGGLNNHALIYIDSNTVLNQNEHSGYENLNLWASKISAIYRHESLC